MADSNSPQLHPHAAAAAPGISSPKSDTMEKSGIGKPEVEHRDIEHAATRNTYIDPITESSLSPEHREYLIQRHGTADLDPIPGFGDADPYNWPPWKKITNLILVAIHACMATFTASSIIPAYEIMAADLGVSIQRISYLTSLQIAILGGAPLFWRPLANHYGRRPIFLSSLLLSLLFNIGCAKSKDYNSMGACRGLAAFFISPAAAIGSAVVTETFFKKDRARYMGIWTLMVTLGVPIAPFIFGFVANAHNVGYRWIYWIIAIINGVQFVAYLFLGPETRYIHTGVEHRGSDFKQEYMNFGRLDPNPLSIWEFIQPLLLVRYLCIFLPACAYAMTFLFASVLVTVELPQLFGPKFEFNPQQLGYQFASLIIGSIIGEQAGGILSDYWMNSRTKKTGVRPKPEYRLWLSYSGFLLVIIGLTVFLVQTENAKQGHWNISPVVGLTIAGAGNQIVTTVLTTYAVDSHVEHSGSIGVFINFIRSTWGFIGPFWFPDMFTNVGIAKSAALISCLIIIGSIAPTLALQWQGPNWRKSSSKTEPVAQIEDPEKAS